MRKEYHKLVRDKIPEIIKKNHLSCEFRTLPELEYRQALRQKLVEESQEVAEAIGENLLKELADLSEVMDALMASYGISRKSVWEAQKKGRGERGGFEEKIMLLWTEDKSRSI